MCVTTTHIQNLACSGFRIAVGKSGQMPSEPQRSEAQADARKRGDPWRPGSGYTKVFARYHQRRAKQRGRCVNFSLQNNGYSREQNVAQRAAADRCDHPEQYRRLGIMSIRQRFLRP